MRLQDCAVKAANGDYWLYHTASSYRVRLDARALDALASLLARPAADGLPESEAYIHERLASRGLLANGVPGSPAVAILRRSALRTLDLELSSRCNLSCGHCFAALDNRSQMDRAVLEGVFAGVSELEPINLVLNGGEPLLNPLWRDAVEEGRRRNLRVVLYTNGTLVTDRIATFLARMRVAKVAVSLDGFEMQHDTLRGPGSFARATTGIRRLVAAGLQTFVTTMCSDETLARKEEWERFCLQDLGVAGLRFGSVVPVGKGGSAPPSFQVGSGVLRQVDGGGRVAEDVEAAEESGDGKAWPCEAGVEQIFIASDGGVYSCHYFQNLREPLGDLRHEGLATIYRAGLAGPVAARTSWRQLPGCRDCPALAACQGGCRARAKLISGSFEAADPCACEKHGIPVSG